MICTGLTKKEFFRFLIVFCVFTLEALIHYAIGKTGWFIPVLPNLKDFLKIVSVVAFMSLVSTLIQWFIIDDKEEQEEQEEQKEKE